MANPIHRTNIVAKDKRSQRKVADSTTELAKTFARRGAEIDVRARLRASSTELWASETAVDASSPEGRLMACK